MPKERNRTFLSARNPIELGRILISKNWKNNYGIADRKINERIIVLPVKIRWLILKDSTESVLRESFKNFTNVRSSCSKWTPLVRFKKRTPKHQDVCIFGKNALFKKSGLSRFCQTDLVQKIRTSVFFSQIASEATYRHDVDDIRWHDTRFHQISLDFIRFRRKKISNKYV